MSNEDLSQRRNENNYMYSLRIQKHNLDKENEKHQRTMQMQTEKVMNQTTDRTQLHQSSKSIFKDPEVNSAREIMQKTNDINYIVETLKEILPTRTPKRITELKNSLRIELEEFRKNRSEKLNKKRYAFNPNAMNKCI